VRLFLLATITGALLISGCYNQPVISPQRPLACHPTEGTGQCPKGFSCVLTGVCAPQSCSRNEDCPAGLSCTSRGCVPSPDAGITDGSILIPNLPDAAAKPSELDAPEEDLLPEDAPVLSLPDGGQR
jgi:hypothetical protein